MLWRHSRKLKLNPSGVNFTLQVAKMSQHLGRSLLSNIIPVALGSSLHFRLSLALPLSLLIDTWYAFPTSNYSGYPSFTTSVEATCPYLLCFAAWPRKPLYMKKGLFCITHYNETVKLYMSKIQVTGNHVIVISGTGFLLKRFGFGSYLIFSTLL